MAKQPQQQEESKDNKLPAPEVTRAERKMMNKARRKRLAEAAELLEQARDILEEVKDEEQEAHDNLPESLQQSERGEEMESYIEAIGEAQDYADKAYCAISDIA